MIKGTISLPGYIVPQLHIALKVVVSDKIACLKTFADILCDLDGNASGKRAVYGTLMKRERLSTTGVGNGVALPHGKVMEWPFQYPSVLIGVLENAVDFEAHDDRPVDLVMVIVVPPCSDGALHLKLLASISNKIIRDKNVCIALRAAMSLEECGLVLQKALLHGRA